MQTEYKGKIHTIIDTVIGLTKKHRDMPKDYIIACLHNTFPELQDTSHCPNCSAKMTAYVFEFDILDALMLIFMGKDVRKSLEKGVRFTDANAVKVQRLQDATYAMKSRTTQMSKLGLVAKYKNKEGRQVPGVWLITRRGWQALAGQRVPKKVLVWRNKIQERDVDSTTTIYDAMQNHADSVAHARALGRIPKTDYREYMDVYNAESWIQYVEMVP